MDTHDHLGQGAGAIFHIEVKGTCGEHGRPFQLSMNEWCTAVRHEEDEEDAEEDGDAVLFAAARVSRVASASPQLKILARLPKLVREGAVRMAPSALKVWGCSPGGYIFNPWG